MRMFLTGIATLAVAGATFVASAQPAGPGRGQGRRGDGPNPSAWKQELGLSDEQSAQLQKLWQDERKQAVRRRADMQIARMELDEALNAKTIDEKIVAAKVQALTQLQATALKARVDRRLAVAKLLTPEQREKMKQIRHVRFEGRGRGFGRHGRFGAGPADGRMGAGGPGGAGGAEQAEEGER
jgi:Spy/CpxP family protein refolding chaperone